MRFTIPALVALLAVACSGANPVQSSDGGPDSGNADAGGADAGAADGGIDAGARPECEWGGAPGKCLAASACSAIPDHRGESGSCSAAQVCCIDTPDLADNPPFPAGYKLMTQAQVTPAMTNWAVMILRDKVTYPMYATALQTFGTLQVLAQVEWHPPDFQNGIVHRGVTLFVPQ